VGADHLVDFRDALAEALALPTGDLPPLKAPRRQVSAPGPWGRTNPAAAKRWQVVRPVIKALAEAYHVPVENLISPRPLRAVMWRPDGIDAASLDAQLTSLGARAWQRDLVVPVIADALSARAEPSGQVTARPQV
jgi:ribonuclease D